MAQPVTCHLCCWRGMDWDVIVDLDNFVRCPLCRAVLGNADKKVPESAKTEIGVSPYYFRSEVDGCAWEIGFATHQELMEFLARKMPGFLPGKPLTDIEVEIEDFTSWREPKPIHSDDVVDRFLQGKVSQPIKPVCVKEAPVVEGKVSFREFL